MGGAGARTRRRRASRGARRTPLAAVARPPRPPHTRPTQRFSRVSCDLLVPTTGVVSSIPDLGAIRYVPTRLSVAVYVDFPQHSRYTYTLESQSTLSLPPRVPKPTRILKIPLNPHEKRDSLSLSLSRRGTRPSRAAGRSVGRTAWAVACSSQGARRRLRRVTARRAPVPSSSSAADEELKGPVVRPVPRRAEAARTTPFASNCLAVSTAARCLPNLEREKNRPRLWKRREVYDRDRSETQRVRTRALFRNTFQKRDHVKSDLGQTLSRERDLLERETKSGVRFSHTPTESDAASRCGESAPGGSRG